MDCNKRKQFNQDGVELMSTDDKKTDDIDDSFVEHKLPAIHLESPLERASLSLIE